MLSLNELEPELEPVEILDWTGEKPVAHNFSFNLRKASALHVSIYQLVLSRNSLSFQFYKDIQY
jgi:hypothetical protein